MHCRIIYVINSRIGKVTLTWPQIEGIDARTFFRELALGTIT